MEFDPIKPRAHGADGRLCEILDDSKDFILRHGTGVLSVPLDSVDVRDSHLGAYSTRGKQLTGIGQEARVPNTPGMHQLQEDGPTFRMYALGYLLPLGLLDVVVNTGVPDNHAH